MAGEISKYAMESAYKDVERDALDRTTRQENPKAILLDGQPGAGKSALAAEAVRELRANGGAVVIAADRMREENPRYRQLSREDPQNAAELTQKEAGEWATRLTMAAVENRRNLVVDGTMRSPESIRDLTTRLKENGYEVEARLLAVNAETSITHARFRFEEQVAARGSGAGGLDFLGVAVAHGQEIRPRHAVAEELDDRLATAEAVAAVAVAGHAIRRQRRRQLLPVVGIQATKKMERLQPFLLLHWTPVSRCLFRHIHIRIGKQL